MQSSTDPFTQMEIAWLNIDEYTVVGRSHSIRTVLGSCVGIVVCDANAGLLGMNHFLSPKTGRAVTEAMLKSMHLRGAHRLTARIFGGSNSSQSTIDMGAENVALACSLMQDFGISYTCESVGGISGRNVSALLTQTELVIELTFLNGTNPEGGDDKWSRMKNSAKRAHDLLAKITQK